MAKDSQIDKKEVRKRKSKNNTTISEEAKNHNPNSKKHSVKNNDV
ncbi:hypothetical protein J2Z42_002251 [Clostridium algifaecis]|uniref:Uncharacterized protein n=1 Tax=Clostridium algifaecis TaxID=1472040 RepID=A0ABS4KU42_9CLOT|nr:hypothetical protein [Clostridium algifaecis]MBP2033548.1 hypothetical protein [Clostridium algifaecis]